MEEQKIIALLFARDENAISIMNENFGNSIKVICKNLGLNTSDAEECVNDTFFSVWNKIPPAKPDFLASFVYKIARRKAIDILRKYTASKRNAKIDILYSELDECIPDSSTIEDNFDEKILVETINSWLKTIDDLSKMIFIRRYFYAESISEISKYTGYSKTNITTKLHRLRNELKNVLIKEGVAYE